MHFFSFANLIINVSFYFIDFFFLPLKIKIQIIIRIAAIIAINPGQPKIETNLLPRDIIRPASKTPRVTAEMLVLKSIFKKLAAKVPVQAPVPGRGIPTNKSKAKINLFLQLFVLIFLHLFHPFLSTK